MMSRMDRGPLRVGLAFLVVTVLLTSSAEAQERSVPSVIVGDKTPYRVILDHISGDIEVQDHMGRLQEQWIARDMSQSGLAPLVSVPPDRPVMIVVKNANTLLYDYNVEATQARESRIQACQDIGRSFTQTGLLTGLGAIQGIGAALGTGTELGQTFAEEVDGSFSLSSFARGGGGRRSASQLEEEFSMGAPQVERYLADAAVLAALAESLEDSVRMSARLAESRPIEELLDRLQASVAEELPGLLGAADVVPRMRARLEPFGPSLSLVRGASLGAVEANVTAPWVDRSNELISEVDLAEGKLWTASIALERQLYEIERARRRATQAFVIPSGRHYRRIHIDVVRNESFEGLPALHESVDVFTEPSVSLLCHISIGFAFMDRPIEYVDEDGSVAIMEQEDDLRTTAHLLMHFSLPSAPLLAGMVGVGVGTQRAPDLYVGASLAYFNPLMFNVGWVFQRARQLPEGLSVGGVVASPTAVDNFPRSYRSAFFFGFSVGR